MIKDTTQKCIEELNNNPLAKQELEEMKRMV
jgi:hypothetical protein